MAGLEELHLTTPIAAALERLGWAAADPTVREAAPTAARGHNLVGLTPPAPAYAAPALAGLLSRLGSGQSGLVLCSAVQLEDWGALVHSLAAETGIRVQVAHGTARAMRRVRAGTVDLLVTTPETALALHTRSALRLEALGSVLLAWPETWEEPESLAPLMADLSKESQRIVLSGAPDRVADLVERYARRALTLGASAEVGGPAGPVRTVAVPWARRAAALGELVELLDPATVSVWTADRAQHEGIGRAVALAEPELRLTTGDAAPAELVIAFDPPTPTRLRQLLAAGQVVLLVPPGTESYVARIAAPQRPIRLSGLVEAVTSAASRKRAAIVRALESARPERALLTLAPLFERYDPSVVAAALFELWTGAADAAGAELPPPLPDIPATAKIYVGVGKKDGATVNDLVAVLTKELRVERGKIGRVELRDAYALVEIPAQEAERVATALNGVTIRRRRVTARVDRGGPARPPAKRPPARR
ncbi:MAG TPA: DbpA RNA binding domain-containing protein [Gemmatimonadales bacterium]|nr:DbpA RNA binding domain-containing protein [Gemmatimonadales bacterium]